MKALQRIGPGLPMKVSWEQIIFTPVQSSDNNNFVLMPKSFLQIYLIHNSTHCSKFCENDCFNYGPIAEAFLLKANTRSHYVG